MIIRRLAIKDFKKFDEQQVVFNEHFNVLIGENGAGKTSILEAVAIAINSYVSVIEGRNVRPIRKDDVRRISFEHSIESKLNTSIAVEGEIEGARIDWSIGKPHRDWGFLRKNDESVRTTARKYMERLSEDGGEKLILPLFDYLGSGRLWTESNEKVKIFPKGSRLEGYHHCLSSRGSFKRFVEWFKTMELSALQDKGTATTKIQAIKRAVAACIEDWDSIFFSFEDDMLMAVKGDLENRQTLPFSYLSDGQRNMIGLIADIAYRCVLLNPQLALEATALTPGIVLIDELDLHLHPNWQRTIVGKLKDIFPSIQFITTTHSPFIIQSLKNNELIDLEGKDMADDYYKRSIEDIAEVEMHVPNPQRSERFQRMKEVAKRYYELVAGAEKTNASEEEVAATKQELDELLKPYYDDPAYVAFLESFKHRLGNDETNK